jgi:hypothetical protein
MFNAVKTASTLLAGFLILYFLPGLALSQEGKVSLDFEKNTFSAQIEGVSLKAVLAKVKEKKGI